MKTLLCMLLLLPVISFAQTKADYEKVVNDFMRYYNNRSVDSVIAQYSHTWDKMKEKLWSKELNNELIQKYGKMLSYKFIEVYRDGTGDGGGNGLALFKVKFEKSLHMMAITLDKHNKLETFRFETHSPHIDSVFKRN